MKSSWEYKRLIDLGTFSRGISKHRPRNDQILFTNGKYPFVQTSDVKKANLYIKSNSEFYNEVGLSQSKLWPKGTLCITIAANIAETGILAYPMCFPDSIVGFTANEKFSSELFMYYVFEYLKQQIQNQASGSIQDNINIEYLTNLKIRIPDKKSQDTISDLLSTLDTKIINNNAIAQQLEAMVKTIYDYWFLQFEFPNEEGKPYKSSGGKMVWNEELQREIPTGWDSAKLKDVIIENPKSKIKVSDVKDNGEIPFFTSGANILATSEPIVSGMNCYLNTGGNADVKYYYGEASYSTDTWCITAEDEMKYILPFILDKIKPSMDKVFFQGTGLRHLQKNLLREYRLCIPDKKVAKEFTKVVRNIFKQQHNLWKENKKLESLKQFLLPLLMNGQVSVGNSNKL
ncbi:restriction endonuclease subunit S [Ligilactobacillus saerimneri]|uniref:restriction endonuclease subunit S n=1 Tax=Ligilactobacillus saerimneri TaxID=228229 RepID=UPI0024B10FE1|nr:restriction endonuclease subunit S [Ligilactobacillus saerimneri]MDI9206673.1 restriction endonuclease subunit S [Ligilactobacillus saerimneri]